MNKRLIHFVWVGFALPVWGQSVSQTAQTYKNFKVEGRFIVWEKVYKSEVENPKAQLDRHPRLNVEYGKGTEIGGRRDMRRLCGLGKLLYNWNWIQYPLTIRFEVAVKEGRYKVKVFDIKVDLTQERLDGDRDQPDYLGLERGYLRRSDNSLRTNGGRGAELACVDKLLTDIFTIKSVQPKEEDEDW